MQVMKPLLLVAVLLSSATVPAETFSYSAPGIARTDASILSAGAGSHELSIDFSLVDDAQPKGLPAVDAAMLAAADAAAAGDAHADRSVNLAARSVVPEPGTWALLLVGLALAATRGWRGGMAIRGR